MDLSEALQTSMVSAIAADSSTGGLGNSASNAYIAQDSGSARVIFEDHESYGLDRIPYAGLGASVFVTIVENPITNFEAQERDQVTLRMVILTQRDAGRGRQNAVVYRMRTVFDGASPTHQTGWYFGPLNFDSGKQLQATTRFLRYEMTFVVQASESSAVQLSGRQVQVEFNGVEGLAFGTSLIGVMVDEGIEEEAKDVTRWMDRGPRSSISLLRATITVGFLKTTGLTVIPSGVSADLIVYDEFNLHARTYSGAIVLRKRFSGNAQTGGPSMVYLTFGYSVTGATGAQGVVSI